MSDGPSLDTLGGAAIGGAALYGLVASTLKKWFGPRLPPDIVAQIADAVAERVSESMKELVRMLSEAPDRAAEKLSRAISDAMERQTARFAQMQEAQSSEFRPYWKDVHETQVEMVKTLAATTEALRNITDEIRDLRRNGR